MKYGYDVLKTLIFPFYVLLLCRIKIADLFIETLRRMGKKIIEVYIYIYVCMCVYIYVYTYIYKYNI